MGKYQPKRQRRKAVKRRKARAGKAARTSTVRRWLSGK
jgi:hypothetical protein